MFFNRDSAGYAIVTIRCFSNLLCWSFITLVVVNTGDYAHDRYHSNTGRMASSGSDKGPIVPPAIKTPKA